MVTNSKSIGTQLSSTLVPLRADEFAAIWYSLNGAKQFIPEYWNSKIKVQWLAKKFVISSIYLINLVFLTKVFELLKSCHPHDHLAPNSVRLEASKKVLLVHMPQGAAKLQAVKLIKFFKNCTFLFVSYENSATYEHF